jgi:hypothetical protein
MVKKNKHFKVFFMEAKSHTSQTIIFSNLKKYIYALFNQDVLPFKTGKSL